AGPRRRGTGAPRNRLGPERALRRRRRLPLQQLGSGARRAGSRRPPVRCGGRGRGGVPARRIRVPAAPTPGGVPSLTWVLRSPHAGLCSAAPPQEAAMKTRSPLLAALALAACSDSSVTGPAPLGRV